MKNENDPSPQDNLHERLCAYVLGEGTPEERMAIEREMSQSPQLRAQCDTIERTIGLVKNAMAGSETLSPEAAETVVSAASASRPARPAAMQSVPWLRIAAGIGAVALGFAIVRSSQRSTSLDQRASDTELAKLDEGESNAHALKRMEGLGYIGNERAQSEKAKGTYRGPGDGVPPGGGGGGAAKKESKDQVENGFTQNYSSTDQVAALDRKNIPAQEGLVTNTAPAPTEQQVPKREALQGSPRDSLVPYELDSYVPEPKPRATAGDKAASTGDNFFLGKSESSAIGVGKQAAPSSQAGPFSARPFAGAGVKSQPLVPSGSSAPSSSSSTGPATGGPSASSTRGMDAGLLAKSSSNVSNRQALNGLGYGGSAPAEKLAKLEELKVGRRANEEVALLEDENYAADDRDEVDQARQYYWQLPVPEQQAYLDRQCRRIFDGCRRMPNERPRDMFFRFWGDNPFEVAALDRLSTFSADVDTASYALARRYLNEGQIPEKAQIRTEEFVNYFKSDVPAPTNGVFAIHTDLTPSRFSTDTTRQMMRVVVRGKEMSKVERQPLHLTFVVDVSGSMREQNRLEMVKHAMRLLVSQLEPYDKIGIVKFSSDASVVLQLTSIDQRATIESAIEPLQPDGSTNSNAGLQLGYAIALGGVDPNSISRVVFLSDGVANVGETDPAKIAEQVKPMREKGIYLNTIGVGMNNHNDVLLEQLADKADGMCSYIDSPEEAKKQLVDNFSGAFQPIARDVKIQVEFDPAQVLRYRLLGYENRAIADADFRNDKVDAGEIGAGHQVTALYEIERQAGASGDGPLATVRVRWKEPRNFGKAIESDAATEIAQTVSSSDAKTFEAAGQGYRKAVIVAQFAEILRRSVHARGDSLDDLLNEAVRLQKEIPNDADFNELVLLISKSKDLILRTMPACDELCQAIDQVREASYRRAQLEQLQKEMDAKTLEELKHQNDLLEARLREIVKRRLESQGK